MAQDKDINIPKGVVYKKNFDFINNKAIEVIKKELNSPDYSLFEDMVYCGPNIWNRYKNNSNISKIEKGNITFEIPQSDNSIVKKEGKLIQTKEDFKIFWDEVIKSIKNTDYKIRKLNYNELQYFWYICFYDINEPIFVIENDKMKLIIDFNDKIKILFLEEY